MSVLSRRLAKRRRQRTEDDRRRELAQGIAQLRREADELHAEGDARWIDALRLLEHIRRQQRGE